MSEALLLIAILLVLIVIAIRAFKSPATQLSAQQVKLNPSKGKILQIIPANEGWKAMHARGGSDPLLIQEIICWALIERINKDSEVDQSVIGIARHAFDEITVCEGSSFLGYAPPRMDEEEKKYFIAAAQAKIDEWGRTKHCPFVTIMRCSKIKIFERLIGGAEGVENYGHHG